MQVVGTREAFMALVKRPGFAGMSGMRKDLVSLWASGKRVPSLDKMEEVLLQAGASVVSEKVWGLKNEKGKIMINPTGDTINRKNKLYLASLIFDIDLRQLLEQDGVFEDVLNDWVDYSDNLNEPIEPQIGPLNIIEIPNKRTEFSLNQSILKIDRVVHLGKEYEV